MKGPLHILRRIAHRWAERRRRRRFAQNLRHIHGPVRLDAGPEGVIAIVLVRNGAYYLDAFLAHYRALGIRHFAFIDTGSTDDTLERIAREPGTVVDQCTLPLAGYADLMRAHPAQTYGRDRWCLYVDTDEMLVFEGGARHGLRGLTRYMERQGHTAMMAHVLDMFPKTPLSQVAGLPYAAVLRDFIYYDISAIDRCAYHAPANPFSALLSQNRVSTTALEFYFGGVRRKVFGAACCLTKHPLVFNGPGVTPAPQPHLSMGVTVSDVTGVIKKYKFADGRLADDHVSQTAGGPDHRQNAARASVLAGQPGVSLFSINARRWNRVELLARAGFTLRSEAYARHLTELER